MRLNNDEAIGLAADLLRFHLGNLIGHYPQPSFCLRRCREVGIRQATGAHRANLLDLNVSRVELSAINQPSDGIKQRRHAAAFVQLSHVTVDAPLARRQGQGGQLLLGIETVPDEVYLLRLGRISRLQFLLRGIRVGDDAIRRVGKKPLRPAIAEFMKGVDVATARISCEWVAKIGNPTITAFASKQVSG